MGQDFLDRQYNAAAKTLAPKTWNFANRNKKFLLAAFSMEFALTQNTKEKKEQKSCFIFKYFISFFNEIIHPIGRNMMFYLNIYFQHLIF